MNLQIAKWELSKLLDMEQAIKLVGRDLDYRTSNRMDKLREFIDKEDGSEPQAQEKKDDVQF